MEFTSEDLFETIDRAVRDLLDGIGTVEPPVDALALAHEHFGFTIDYQAADDEPREYGDAPRRRPGPRTIVIQDDQSEESQHAVAARGVAKLILPDILAKLGIIPGTENRSAMNAMVAPLTARLLLPTRWYTKDCRNLAWDLMALKDRYRSVGFEMLAWRMLDVDDEASVIAILDDGSVSARRGNRFTVSRKLEPAEEMAVQKAQETGDPATARNEGWSATAWPTRGVPFRRIFVRAVPDMV